MEQTASIDTETQESTEKDPSTFKRQNDIEDEEDDELKTSDDEFGYRCDSCGCPLHITDDMIDENTIYETLMDEEDFNPRKTHCPITFNIKVEIYCKNHKCDEKVEVAVRVNAIGKTDIKDFEVLPSDNYDEDDFYNPDSDVEADFDEDFDEEPFIEWNISSPREPSEEA